MVLAARNLANHQWTVLEEKMERSGKTKSKRLNVRIFNRQIIAVMDTAGMRDEEKGDITSTVFETEWDRHQQRQYEEQRERDKMAELEDDDDLLIGGIKINFNDSQSESVEKDSE